MPVSIQQPSVLAPAMPLFGRLLGMVAVVMLLIAVIMAGRNVEFQLMTQAVSGEIVASQPVPGSPVAERTAQGLRRTYAVTVEYADDSGQYRRFDQQWVTDPAPAKGDAVRVRFRPSRPADALIADPVGLWRNTLWVSAAALGSGILAEELVRRGARHRRRTEGRRG